MTSVAITTNTCLAAPIAAGASCTVNITFTLERDIEAATQDVRDKVATIVGQFPKDTKPPRTKLLRHPPKLLRVAAGQRKLVAFRFAASESSSFRCKLDRKPYATCRSPRKLRLAAGRHVFRLFAIDAAGNRDQTPAVFQFRVVPKQQRATPSAR